MYDVFVVLYVLRFVYFSSVVSYVGSILYSFNICGNKAAASGSSGAQIVQYDSRGNLVDEARMLAEAGLEVGIYVKKIAGPSPVTGVVEEVGGGKIVVRPLGKKQTLSLSYVNFKDEWQFINDKAEIQDKGVVLNYFETLADNNEAISLARAWGRVQIGLECAQAWVNEHFPLRPIRMETKPKTKVFILEPAKAQSIFFLPHSTSYAFDAATSGKTSTKTFEVDPKWISAGEKVAGKPLFIKPAFVPWTGKLESKQALTEGFWAVRRVEEDGGEEGNMELSSLKLNGSLCTGGSASERSLLTAQNLVSSSPVLRNARDLEAGEELIWSGQWSKKDVAKRKAPVKREDPATKRQKVEESSEW